jgi:hypothetical protein
MCIKLPDTEVRLKKRYHRLVVSHLSVNHRVAAGIHLPPSLGTPFAATQAAWRFYSNERVKPPQLAGPLIECARQSIAQACSDWVLVVMDWSNLHLKDHDTKKDRVELAQSQDLGYELLTALALSDRAGEPLAPLCLEMRAANGVHSTRFDQPFEAPSVLDGLEPVMKHVGTLDLGKPAVFIIDREADSVGHYRQWSAGNQRFLVRADDDRLVRYDLKEQTLGEVADELKRQRRFVATTEVLFEGKPAVQFVAETTVVLHRPARTHRVDPKTGKAKHKNVAGRPLSVRVVISEVRDRRGKVLARWLLLTNLPETVNAAIAALWYYWRWRIETYHKLLKGAGQQLECWQQEKAELFVRRLAVAAMAGVVVWRLAREKSPEAAEMRGVLVRLSGRQMKRGKNARPFTEPALLAGLGVLIPMLELLLQYEVQELRDLVEATLPGILTAPPAKSRRPRRRSG